MDPMQTAIHVVASAVMAVVLIVVGGRRRGSMRLAGMAIALAMVWQFVVQEGWPALPPTSKWHTIVFAVAAIAVLSSILARLQRASPTAERALGPALLASLGLVAIARSPLLGTLQPLHCAALVTAPAIAVLALRGERSPGFGLPAALSFACVSLAGMCLVGSFAKLGIIAASTGFTLGMVALLAWRTRAGLGVAGMTTGIAALGAIAGSGAAYFDGHFTAGLWALPVLAPVAALSADLPFARRRPHLAAFLRVAGPALIAFLALGAAFVQSSTTTSEEESGPDYTGYGG